MSTRLVAAATALSLTAAASVAAEPFTFVAFGDMPYGDPEKAFPPFETLIDTINERAPAFTLHVGDTKSAGTPCSDEMLQAQLDHLDRFTGPVIYTPGDNEWTDCHEERAGGFDPLERLAHIRTTYFENPSISFGQAPIEVQSQAVVMADDYSDYPENVRFVRDRVHVVAAHVVGSNNNFEVRNPDAAMEFFARDAATTAWLADSFDQAQAADAKAVVVAIHGDMFEFDFNEFGEEAWLRHSGFKHFGETLVEKAAAFSKPVLLIFGDSHVFRVFRPFPQTAGNVMALEVFGAADMHAVEITVDPDDPVVFGYRPLLNPARDAWSTNGSP